MIKTKVCSKCGKELPITKFIIVRGLQRASICNVCHCEEVKKHRSRYGEMPWYEEWYLKNDLKF
jgi:NAD-dependent SIR2 family protein deacetylase